MSNTPKRNAIKVIERIKDNTEAIGITIQDNDGAAIDVTGRTFTVDVIDMDTDTPAASALPASIVTAAEGKITFTPSAAAVDTVGYFAIYAIDNSGRRFPYDGARLQLHVKEAGSA